VGDLVALLGAIALVIGSAGTATAAVITALRASPKERRRAARGALDRLRDAAADGEITPAELADVLREDDSQGGDEEP
jgi:hypothetical protein